MPTIAYHAVDATGKRSHGRLEAASPGAAVRLLEARGLLVVTSSAVTEPRTRGLSFGSGERGLALEFARALAVLLPAGMPLARALATAAQLAEGRSARILESVRASVERGDPLAVALQKHPRTFSPVVLGLVRAGERSGDLPGAFERLASQLEREAELRSRLVSASVYPLILVGVGGLAILVLLTFVLPRFVELLDGTGAPLPRSTALLVAVSAWFDRVWLVALALAVAAVATAAWAGATPRGKRAGARLLLDTPVAGGLRRTALGARFARLLAMLVGGGAPLLSALEDTAACLGDPIARDEVGRIRLRVREGAALHATLAESSLFPPLLARLVAVGEEGGRLHELLLKAADALEARTERLAQRVVVLLEPAMIVAFGAVITFVALSLLQAVYGVNTDALR